MKEAIKINDSLLTYEIKVVHFELQKAMFKLRCSLTKMINIEMFCMINDNGILNL